MPNKSTAIYQSKRIASNGSNWFDYQLCFNFRMETHGEPGKIQLSSATKAILDLTESGKYNIYPRGQIDIKVWIIWKTKILKIAWIK